MEPVTTLIERLKKCSGEAVELIPLTSPEALNQILRDIKDPNGKWRSCNYSEKKFLRFKCPAEISKDMEKHTQILFVDYAHTYSQSEYLVFTPSTLTDLGGWTKLQGMDAQLLHELLSYKREMKASFKKNFYLAVIPSEK